MTADPLASILTCSVGTSELTPDIEHSAVAAFRRGFLEGQLTGRWQYVSIVGAAAKSER
jgi:hypothetical protein